MARLSVGDVVYLRVTFEEGVVSEVISENDYFVIWRTGERGIHNGGDLVSFSDDEFELSFVQG